jgi:hypothetical protein
MVLSIIIDKIVCIGILQQFGETGSAMVTTASVPPSSSYHLILTPQIQVIAVYTFVVVMWGTFRRQLRVAYSVISIIVIFLVIFIAATVSTQTHGSQHYMAPAGVSPFLHKPQRYLYLCRYSSSGVGLATDRVTAQDTMQNATLANISGYGSHLPYR